MPAVLKLPRLDLSVHLGVTEEERRETQTVFVAVEVVFREPPVGIRTDRLTDTLDYGGLCNRLREAARREPFQLLERLAGVLLATTIEFIGAAGAVRVEVTKFPPIDGLTGGASFSLEGGDPGAAVGA